MPEKVHRLLESVINITRERDKRSLEYSFIDMLSDSLEFEVAMLINVSAGSDDWNLEILSYYCQGVEGSTTYARPKIMVPMDDHIRSSITEQMLVSESVGGSSRSIFPVVVNNSVKSLLIVYARQMNETTSSLIQSFVQIYGNFLAVLDDNERDTLTGLFNRKAFDIHIAELLQDVEKQTRNEAPQQERRAKAVEMCRWLGILDIDHFKRINDSFGHLYGDEVLMIFADLMEESFRKSDLLFRYGGEEFVVILTPTTQQDGLNVFERFRKNLEKYEVPQVGRVTVSIGVAKILPNTHPAIVLENADQSLYYAKEHGRNQVANYHDLIDRGILKVRKIVDEIELF